jgi:uncharacterized protein YukE
MIARLHNQWSGPAAAAHKQAHSEWAQGAQMMAEGVQRMQRAVSATHSAFENAARSNQALFS